MGMTKLLTVKDVSKILRVSERQIRVMIRDQLIPAVKIDREWRMSEEQLQEILDAVLKM